MSRPAGPRIDAAPFLAWVETQRPFHQRIDLTEERAITRARKLGYMNPFMADRIATHLGCPQMMRLLYDEDGAVAA